MVSTVVTRRFPPVFSPFPGCCTSTSTHPWCVTVVKSYLLVPCFPSMMSKRGKTCVVCSNTGISSAVTCLAFVSLPCRKAKDIEGWRWNARRCRKRSAQAAPWGLHRALESWEKHKHLCFSTSLPLVLSSDLFRREEGWSGSEVSKSLLKDCCKKGRASVSWWAHTRIEAESNDHKPTLDANAKLEYDREGFFNRVWMEYQQL